ncbi:MAG: hypothetical protein LBH18_02765 [Spirochaetaceae bacterium]|jgi:hypothetical protein|nr:hypothetical protein [Spirochaetaceae bacterium]
MKDDSGMSSDGRFIFQTLLDGVCDKLWRKSAALTLIRLKELDAALRDIEKTLSLACSIREAG